MEVHLLLRVLIVVLGATLGPVFFLTFCFRGPQLRAAVVGLVKGGKDLVQRDAQSPFRVFRVLIATPGVFQQPQQGS